MLAFTPSPKGSGKSDIEEVRKSGIELMSIPFQARVLQEFCHYDIQSIIQEIVK